MISGVRNVSTLDRGRRQDHRPGTAAGSQVGSGWRCPEDLSLPPPTLRWAELAHRPYGLAAVGPGCDTTDLLTRIAVGRGAVRGRGRMTQGAVTPPPSSPLGRAAGRFSW